MMDDPQKNEEDRGWSFSEDPEFEGLDAEDLEEELEHLREDLGWEFAEEDWKYGEYEGIEEGF